MKDVKGMGALDKYDEEQIPERQCKRADAEAHQPHTYPYEGKRYRCLGSITMSRSDVHQTKEERERLDPAGEWYDKEAKDELPLAEETVQWEALKLRQFAMEVPEYDWLTNSATLVRIAEEMAADKGWRLDDKRMPIEEAGDSPARLTLVWLAEDLNDKAKAWELLLERRLPETARYWTYWLPKMAWDQQTTDEEQDHLRQFALRMLRYEGHLVQGNCELIEDEVGGLAVVGLRWRVSKPREVVDLDSQLV